MTRDWPEAVDRFLTELRRWAPRTNLVGSTEPAALRRHVEDSLAAAQWLPHGARVVDLGSGAGFPGIPLVIVRPDLDLTLVEIRERRVHFLRHVVRSLDLGCRVDRRRIEEPPAERFDYALLRAVAAPPVAAKLAQPWLATGAGEAWIWSGPDAEFEWDRRSGAIQLGSGGQIRRIRSGAAVG
jgi:16S rRNA (guanine527-N7)-methyltransferase